MAESVQSVVRAVDLVEQLASADGDIPLSELARRTGLRPPTAHRILRTLVARDWVVQDLATNRYRLSHKLLAVVGGIEARTQRLRAVARPHLAALRDLTGESTNLVILDGLAAVYVDQVQSDRPIRMFAETGACVPAYASAAGKAILAFAPPATQRALEHATFEQLTEHTIVGHNALELELGEVRERGYAIDNEEYELGVVCIAAPVLVGDGGAAAAISVSAPATRWQTLDLATLGGQLAEHASRLSAELSEPGR